MEDATGRFTAIDNRNETREILSSVYDSLKVKGYNPITSSLATLSPRTRRTSLTTTTPGASSAGSTATSCFRSCS